MITIEKIMNSLIDLETEFNKLSKNTMRDKIEYNNKLLKILIKVQLVQLRALHSILKMSLP